ncbi:MAG: hypothetical protein AAF618_11645 [Pseudomonadota bacterium]
MADTIEEHGDGETTVSLGRLFGELFAALEDKSASFTEASERFRAEQAGLEKR